MKDRLQVKYVKQVKKKLLKHLCYCFIQGLANSQKYFIMMELMQRVDY
jgi:hypothetical protein